MANNTVEKKSGNWVKGATLCLVEVSGKSVTGKIKQH
jgi:hypothetical protein